jgi:hypothetical protein
MGILIAKCQNNKLLSYFPLIDNDSIIHTGDDITSRYGSVCGKFEDAPVPDSITLKYFFNNDTSNLYFQASTYDYDNNTFSYGIVKKDFCPIFYKKYNKNTFLLCYYILEIIYLSFYDITNDSLLSSYVVSDCTDENGNIVTHSIIFPDNYIATIEIRDEDPKYPKIKVFYRLVRINYKDKKFEIVKQKNVFEDPQEYEKYYEKVYNILGINKRGELIE